MKKVSIIILVIMIFGVVSGFVGPAEKDIKVIINGERVIFEDQQPVLDNSRVLVPIRKITEELGFKVEWNSREEKIKLIRNKDGLITDINLQLGSTKVWIKTHNEKTKDIYVPITTYKNIELDVPAKAVNGTTLVPIRAISEMIGLNVDWKSTQNTVIINEEKKEKETEIISHYSGGRRNLLKNDEFADMMLNAVSNSFDNYSLAVLDIQVEGLYKEANFLELVLPNEKSIKMKKFNNIRIKKVIVILEDNENFSEGMVLTENRDGTILVWAITDEEYKPIVKKIQ